MVNRRLIKLLYNTLPANTHSRKSLGIKSGARLQKRAHTLAPSLAYILCLTHIFHTAHIHTQTAQRLTDASLHSAIDTLAS